MAQTNPGGSGNGPATTGAGGFVPIRTTKPKEIIRHDISDEELNQMISFTEGNWNNAMWAFLGGALGFLPSSIESIYASYIATTLVSLSPLHLVEIILLFVLLASSGLSFSFAKRNKNNLKALTDEIKKRKKHTL